MPKKQTLTVVELKALLLARFNAEQSKRVKLQARLQQELGNVQEETPEAIAIRNKFADWISEVLARRLKRNRRTTPLFSSRDFVRFIPSMIKEIAKVEGGELEDDERKMFEKFMKSMFKNKNKFQNMSEMMHAEMMHAMMLPRRNPYEEHWRWVTTVLDLATERGILPTELLALEGMTDEITRRMFTKRQFATLSKKTVNEFADIDVLKKIIVQTRRDMVVTEADEEEQHKLEQELEAELMPQLRETVEKNKVIINTFLDEEVERIYAVA